MIFSWEMFPEKRNRTRMLLAIYAQELRPGAAPPPEGTEHLLKAPPPPLVRLRTRAGTKQVPHPTLVPSRDLLIYTWPGGGM